MRTAVLAAGLCLSMIGSSLAQTAAAITRVNTRIPPQALESALKDLADTRHLQVLFLAADVKGLRTTGVSGYLTVDEVLGRLLAGTGLSYRYVDSNAVSIIAASPKSTVTPSAPRSGRPRSSQHSKSSAASGGGDPATVPAASQKEFRERRKEPPLQEVVVTGTLIPGLRNLASPLTVFTRTDIDDSGASTVQQFMQQQSFDWGGGASDATVGELAGGGTADNRTEGSGFNLRGLGNDATLVLINGQRIAPGNTDANFVDTSLIPLTAIDRIEVEPAGASAIYGADAVGGVVNLILRPSFQGEQTSVRYGTATEGGTREVQADQLSGRTWSSGSAVLGYQFEDRAALFASDRDFSMQAASPFTLLPEQVRQSVFLNMRQDITTGSELFATGFYAHRGMDEAQTFGTAATPLFSVSGSADTSVGEGILGTNIEVSPRNAVSLALLYSRSHSTNNSLFDTFPSLDIDASYSVMSFSGKLTGKAFDRFSGPVAFAIGGELRRESLDSRDLLAYADFQPSRSILSAFLELNLPVLSSSAGSSGLDISGAGRVDRYSDFGTTINPNIGLSWRPIVGLKFRSTFGTSFVAPELSKLNPIPYEVSASSVHDPLTGGFSNALEVYGGNSALRPETADIFTAGVEFNGTSSEGLHGGLTYYHIDFKHVILSIQEGGINPDNGLDLENQLGPSIIQRNPSPLEVSALASTPGYVDLTGTPGGVALNSIVAIIDSRELNLARLRTNGVDLNLSYARATGFGTIEGGVDGTWIARFERQIVPAIPAFSLLNTPYNPINVKARGKVAFTNGGWLVAGFLNYVNRYEDNREPPTVPIASWTTVDLTLRYRSNAESGALGGTAISLSIVNIGDRAPPFVTSPSPPFEPGITFDGANANVLGRFLSLEVSRKW